MTKPVDRPKKKPGPKPTRRGITIAARLHDYEVDAVDKLVAASKEPTTRSTMTAMLVAEALTARGLLQQIG